MGRVVSSLRLKSGSHPWFRPQSYGRSVMRKGRQTEITKNAGGSLHWVQRLRGARLPLTVCGLALLVYSRSLFCGFVRDDTPQIVHNRQVQSWEYLPQLLGSHLWSQLGHDVNMIFYRPLFSVWMLIVHTFGGLEPWFWHLSSILLHVVATYLVFRLCLRLTNSQIGAAAAAAIFAVHPIHVDAVTWVSASCEVLFAIFAIAAILALLGADESSKPRFWLSAALYGAGLLAKETGIAMLVILVSLAWVNLKDQFETKKFKRVWAAFYPFGAVTAFYLLVRSAVMHSHVGVETGEHTWAETIYSSPSIFFFYLKKLFLPLRLSGCYVNPITASPTGTFWLEVAFIGIGAALIAWAAVRYSPLLGLAAALIVVPVLPALAVIRIYPQGDMTHDRYLYMSSVGLSLLIAILVKQAWSMQKSARIAVTALVIASLIAFSVETFSQQWFYHDEHAFYSRVIKVSPSDAIARGMLGNVYLDDGRVDLALEQFQRANQIDPENQKVSLFLARGLYQAGKLHEAREVLNKLLSKPDLTAKRRDAALLSLGNVEISLGNLDAGEQMLDQVNQNDPKFPELHWALGVLHERQGLLPEAKAEYEKEFEITGDERAEEQSETVAKMIYSQSAPQPTTESNGH